MGVTGGVGSDTATVTITVEPPVFNGDVSGIIIANELGVVTGTLTGDFSLSVSGQLVPIIEGQTYSFTGSVTGEINGSISGGMNINGIDTLSGTITGTDAELPVRILGTFPQTGIDGDFVGKIVTGTVPVYPGSIAITGPTSVGVGDSIQLGITSDPQLTSD